MSYDLLFLSDPERSVPDRDLFREQFAGRPFYRVDKDQAIYENPDTGVYFIFDLVTEPLADEPPSWLSFTLNFYRPHYFALEALPELEAIVKRTSGVVLDPQDSDPAPRAFVAEQFLTNWNHGNEQAYRIMPEEERKEGIRGDRLTYPTRLLEAIWRWNSNRQQRQAEVGENVFVPRISFINVGGRAQSTAVWTDAIPTHLPKVDAVLIYRDQLRTKKWFGGGDPNLALAPWNDLAPLLQEYSHDDGPIPFKKLTYAHAPNSLVQYLRSLPVLNPKPTLVSMDSVLNADLFSERVS